MVWGRWWEIFRISCWCLLPTGDLLPLTVSPWLKRATAPKSVGWRSTRVGMEPIGLLAFQKVCIESIAEVCRSQHLSTSDRHPQFSEVDLPPGFTVFSLFLVSFQVLKVIIILTFQLDIPLPASQPSFPQAFRVHRWILSLDLETTRTTSAGSSHFWRSKLQHTEKKWENYWNIYIILPKLLGYDLLHPPGHMNFWCADVFFNEVSPGILQHIQEDMTYIIALS
jgi:hypothetical protein